jgi:hypothetical protein
MVIVTDDHFMHSPSDKRWHLTGVLYLKYFYR